jgi:hypothetical protein
MVCAACLDLLADRNFIGPTVAEIGATNVLLRLTGPE